MADVLLTLYCSRADAGMIAAALRGVTGHPVHQRDETVHGFDFSDATAAERVIGQLDRCALDVRTEQSDADALLGAVQALPRVGAVRWRLTPVIASGRFA